MKKIAISLALVGSVLTTISERAAGHSTTDKASEAEELQVSSEEAAIIMDLVNRGHIELDFKSRRFILKTSVVKILESYNLLHTDGVREDPVKTTGTRC